MEFEILNLPIDNINVDSIYQRDDEISENNIRNMVKNFNEKSLSVLLVNQRDDGQYYVVDGQHRLEALKRLSKEYVWCQVYRNLSLDEEIEIYIQRGKHTKSLTPHNLFKARLARNEKNAVEINEIVNKHGFIIITNGSNSANKITAVLALQKIFKETGSTGLDRTLKIIKESWDGDKYSLQQRVLYGLNYFLKLYWHEIDELELIRKLRENMPITIKSKGQSLTDLTGGDPNINVARVILGIYNERKKTKRLGNKFQKNYE